MLWSSAVLKSQISFTYESNHYFLSFMLGKTFAFPFVLSYTPLTYFKVLLFINFVLNSSN